MLRQSVLCFIFIFMAAPGSSHYNHLLNESSDVQVDKISQHFNQSSPLYHHLAKSSHLLSDKQVQLLRKQGYPHFAFEWAIRLTEQKKYQQAGLLIERYWDRVNHSMRVRLLELLKQQNRYHSIARIFENSPAIEPYNTLSLLALGESTEQLESKILSQLGITTLSTFDLGSSRCAHLVLLLSNTLESTLKLGKLKQAYEQSELAKQLPYCLSEPIYVGEPLQCTGGTGQFIRCSLIKVAGSTALAQARHLVIMSEQSGLANVRHGVMSMNHNHGLELFIHELMHFTHFEDEYPVPINKANWLCASAGLKAPNLYVGKHPPQNWHASKTCLHGKLPSYKPSQVLSKMEYHAIDLSNQYLGLWLKALEQSLLEPSDYQIYHHKLVNRDSALVK
ncbi:hypothetical protein [Pseudoalteromonas luteoviolacea]|uniref:Orphan protein n=1 Tax=Pseudoalteromonas luteoviolacea S4060-1 TaxID=1365257 RepID=A0A167L282_9GAMM|nr:hypothetical protein [Pseudoalteromonas luteoviolacea]KZN63687.1 hypothetical protein N478_24420 [Pseudoalteromonas luteoviolacea S4060-1]